MNLVVGVTLYCQPNYYHKILAIDYNWQLANIKKHGVQNFTSYRYQSSGG